MEPLELATLPQRLRDHGYQSFGFIANPMAGLPRLGFHRGFEHYQQVYAGRLTESPAYGNTPYRLVYPEDINARVAELIGVLRPTHTFAYLHYLQPHLQAFAPASPESIARLEARYREPAVRRRRAR